MTVLVSIHAPRFAALLVARVLIVAGGSRRGGVHLVKVLAEVAFEGEVAPEGKLAEAALAAAGTRGRAAQLLQHVRFLMARHSPLAYRGAAGAARHLGVTSALSGTSIFQ